MTIWYEHAGSGDPVVLLHSTAADSGMWDGQWETLAERFHVIRVDLRGFGRTPWQAGEPYSDARDVAGVLEELGLRDAAVVGSSGGAEVALEVGALGVARSLVLLNPACDLTPTEDVAAYWKEEGRLIELGDLDGAAELNARLLLGPEAAPEARRRLAAMQLNAYRVQLAADPEPERLKPAYDPPALDVPALVVSGAHDLSFFQSCARHLAATMPRARALHLDWAGHLPAMERPQEVSALLLDYL
ncbi:alpha/beta fold hydrolase [Nonomuraea pusilla]|uniref:Pimeloyl-ACP methyl ester carboxylesterase n=1 Tax=Nonomuraea pusilla TaxID=46177 RepID=A0A1H7T1U3_9ACTN|nr:alpha/beta hydrolase [Nonomuraea pusilla]SEL78890.1 Pimeloyl-ACP methyl ester carboxylesterase [Nonomuraea pusilla]